MSWVAAGVAGASVVGGYFANKSASDAAAGAAGAQAGMAEDYKKAILGYSDKAGKQVTDLAAATPQELNSLGQSYQAASQSLEQQQRLMASIDPALMEASKQALTLLRGGQAQMNQPMMDMRNQQRAQLVSSLKAQYGPGAETSQVGQQALNQFDMQSQQMFQQNQQGSLSQLMGIADNPNNGMGVARASNSLDQIASGYGNIQNRQVGAQTNVMNSTLSALSGVAQQGINTAGSQYVGQGLQAQGLSSLANMGMNIGGNMLGRQYGGAPSSPNLSSNVNATGNPAANWQPSNSFSGSNPYAAGGAN